MARHQHQALVVFTDGLGGQATAQKHITATPVPDRLLIDIRLLVLHRSRSVRLAPADGSSEQVLG